MENRKCPLTEGFEDCVGSSCDIADCGKHEENEIEKGMVFNWIGNKAYSKSETPELK